MTCFIERQEGIGKSTMCRFLALDDRWFWDGIDLADPEVIANMQGKWIIEFSEMDEMKKTSLAKVKGFLTRQVDTYRVKYGICPTEYGRQCIYLGTANDLSCLSDDPNRRYLPLQCSSEHQVIHPLKNEKETRAYIEQCYAEAMQSYRSGNFSLDLNEKYNQEIAEIREGFSEEDPIKGRIENWLDYISEDIVCTKMIASGIHRKDIKNITLTTKESQAITKAMETV